MSITAIRRWDTAKDQIGIRKHRDISITNVKLEALAGTGKFRYLFL
jgi:hypothetical protein